MRRFKTGTRRRTHHLGIAAIVVTAAVASSNSCLLDTETHRCESGRRCRPGQVCAARQDACIDLGGCGDGILSAVKAEVCDDGNILDGDGCSSDCKSEETCGNGIEDVRESCDDGNTISGDGCSADCVAEVCGNWIVDQDVGEVCDDGNARSDDGCSSDCKSNEACGNGVIDNTGPGGLLHEECEFTTNPPFPGPVLDAATCDRDCTFPRCGDGHLNPLHVVIGHGSPHHEECDTGSTDSPSCDRDCTFARCGDGYRNTSMYLNMPVEECDDGAGNSNTQPDACRTDCRGAFCGDGVLDTGETCDDDNGVKTDLCPSGAGGTCKPAVCGDGHVRMVERPGNPPEPPEECDNGSGNNNNMLPGACRTDCRKAFCGDGVKDTGEVCDPGGAYGNGQVGCTGISTCKNSCSVCG